MKLTDKRLRLEGSQRERVGNSEDILCMNN